MTVVARDLWMQWADGHAAKFAEQQWLLSKYEVSANIAWPQEKISMLTELLWDRLGLAPGARVVELCCGGGWLLGNLMERGARGMGIDFADNMIRIARHTYRAGRFMVADASACPLPDACADAVLCYAALINIESPEIRQGILDETRRLLRPGGHAVIGQMPLRNQSHEYDAAKERYFAHHHVSTSLHNPLREDCRMPIVLFSEDDLLSMSRQFSKRRLEPAFNHLWLPGDPLTCPWRVDLCLAR
jgi:ubiquinone/menaquinone biosynthesis C-methylase UbiE